MMASGWKQSRRGVLSMGAATGLVAALGKPARVAAQNSAPPNDGAVIANVMVPMRDGTRLASDIYFPAGAGPEDGRSRPAVVIRTPYDKSVRGRPAERDAFLAFGFVVLVQDKRGTSASEGRHRLLEDDADGPRKDGYDTIDWVARQSWCDGRVGIWGGSYLGYMAIGAAITNPPALKGSVVVVPSSDMFTDQFYVDGVMTLLVAGIPLGFDQAAMKRIPADMHDVAAAELELARKAGPRLFMDGPLLDLPWFRFNEDFWGYPLRNRENPAAFVESTITKEQVARISTPVLHIGGWFDHFIRNTLRQFNFGTVAAKTEHHLVIGPWGHGVGGDQFGERSFPGGAVDLAALSSQWMADCFEDRVAERRSPRISLYVMGANRWRSETAFPPPDATMRSVYLAAGGSLADGKPEGDPEPTAFIYDPSAPYTAPRMTEEAGDLTRFQFGHNLAVFTGDTLTGDCEIVGYPSFELFAATDCTDTDWVVELHEVTPSGQSYLLTEGICRARYRESRTAPKPVVPGAITKYTVALRPIAVRIAAPSRLRVVVTSGKFPAFERNPNAFVDLNHWSSSDTRIAHQKIHHDTRAASRLILPVVDRGEDDSRWIANPFPRA